MPDSSTSGEASALTRRGRREAERRAVPPMSERRMRAPRAKAASPGTVVRRVLARVLPVGVMLFVGLLVAGMSIPAQAVPFSGSAAVTAAGHDPFSGRNQSFAVAASVGGLAVARDSYAVADTAAQRAAAAAAARAQVAKLYKNSGDSSAGEPSRSGVAFIGAPGPVLWPTDVSPEIGKGVTNSHRGQDLLMAGGTPVHAIADGVVLTSAVQGSYGQYVVLQSTVGGHTVTSLYAHMQIGSSGVSAGQTITAGTTIGLVGSSGAATANLLYLRIMQDDQLVDTVTYIKANPAGGAAPH